MDAVRLAVCDLILTGLHFPDIGHTPGSDDLQIRSQSLDAQLKTDLVVALTGSAVADSGSALFAGDLNQLLCDQPDGPWKCRADICSHRQHRPVRRA